ncbi:MAG: alpha-amylase family glycosyl hydrolase [Bacteroidales bacterium]|nr:alpha-amylase family glycosyl hydrolase [Bacteroidales bacterium]
MKDLFTVMREAWSELYSDSCDDAFNAFCEELKDFKKNLSLPPAEHFWYKKAVVYSLYVDLFNDNFAGLSKKLDYLQNLGINCLWLLPVLDSPMKDAGFDVRNYYLMRKALFGLKNDAPDSEAEKLFDDFLNEAHKRNIRIIFDVALNHCSNENPWFMQSKDDKTNCYRNYFIWNKDDKKYAKARLIFKGMCPSNWEKYGDEYYFHRFFEFQPDLNYRNHKVLLEMIHVILYWLNLGVDGFRADAIPYLWKEENTDCENLEGTHTILRFIKAVLDYVRPNMLLLAEACQPPEEVVKYFGKADECNAGYHFPLMPMIYKTLAMKNRKPIVDILATDVTPEVSIESQWFMFLRCHDELSLELVYVSEEDRKYIHDNYCHKPQWDFRLGEGISARLSELMQFDVEKELLAYSIMLTLPGTPIIYYGDEFGKGNDEEYYREQKVFTGKDDTRFLVRGKIDWDNVEKQLADENSFSYKLFSQLKTMINKRNETNIFGSGKLEWVDLNNDSILAYFRVSEEGKKLVINNLLDVPQTVEIQGYGTIQLGRYGFIWL